jgi:hypothetical protein
MEISWNSPHYIRIWGQGRINRGPVVLSLQGPNVNLTSFITECIKSVIFYLNSQSVHVSTGSYSNNQERASKKHMPGALDELNWHWFVWGVHSGKQTDTIKAFSSTYVPSSWKRSRLTNSLCSVCVCVCVCVCVAAFQLQNQATDFHEIWYERYAVRCHSKSYFVIS